MTGYDLQEHYFIPCFTLLVCCLTKTRFTEAILDSPSLVSTAMSSGSVELPSSHTENSRDDPFSIAVERERETTISVAV